ncbi:MAG: exosome complex exonuclease Rrp41 [Candidatus Nanoarchaeia archaeon]|nr:exosome complex exonuclease Rrp41 [Candidatus Nanoarchaeia archaeon]MDD5357648.1 exosome complex exonuclease Rrp41 [Candidatus Nanoarchaeia archaeon]MDD5588567.1 exosome complex exonuclease Rrp41 [Candidatus Nanoarchaeia archaeon]
MTKDFKRPDGRKVNELRKITAKVGVVPNADGSAMFAFGDTIAIAAVYGPKKMHPQHAQDPEKGTLRCNYNMLSFSVTERIRPGPSRRSTEISKITEWALKPVVMIDDFAGQVVDVHINILQANASTRCAGINAAAMALAHAGIPMKSLVTSVSIGKLDKQLVTDLIKEEEDWEEGEGPTDIPITLTGDGKISHIQLDGKIGRKQLEEAVELAKEAGKQIHEAQEKALKAMGEKNE